MDEEGSVVFHRGIVSVSRASSRNRAEQQISLESRKQANRKQRQEALSSNASKTGFSSVCCDSPNLQSSSLQAKSLGLWFLLFDVFYQIKVTRTQWKKLKVL
jgi:hypothetical protein